MTLMLVARATIILSFVALVNCQFSLFSIISFPDDLCLTNNGKTGTCLSAEKCGAKGGVNLGTCAKGFGVCCYCSVSPCSSSVRTNTSYILNPNFPNAYNTPGTCTYYVHKQNINVCQFRLDFKLFTLRNPPNTGICSEGDKMQVSTAGEFTPIICGKNNNYHMYIDLGMEETATSEITFQLTDQMQNRYWEVLVTQLACDDYTLAPRQCLQFLTGITGTLVSFNWYNTEAPYHLADQQYSICIRQEMGYCSITYTAIEDSDQGSTGWELDKTRTCTASDSLCRGEQFCNDDFLVIPQGRSDPSTFESHDRFCGVALTDGQSPTPATNVPITSQSLPFVVHFKSGSSNLGMDRGFRLSYRQNVC